MSHLKDSGKCEKHDVKLKKSRHAGFYCPVCAGNETTNPKKMRGKGTTRPRKKRHAIYDPSGNFVRKIKPMKRTGHGGKKSKGGHRFHRMKSTG